MGPWIAAAVLVMALGVALPAAPAFAEDGTPPPPGGERAEEQLERCLERLEDWHAVQGQNLDRAAQAIERIEQALEKAESRGMDVREGEALLAEMVSLLAKAENHHDEAGEILEVHAGYAGDGSVVDLEQAGDTCRMGRDAQANARDALLDMRQTGRELFKLARDWWQRHRQTPAAPSE
jgi:hypothetical protein